MTSTIKVNNVQNQCGQNIINENSNTITIGASGDTIALASGASQTGFGRNGAVNWQTSIKTGDFTSVSGEGYFVDTSSGEIDVTLPSSPSAGDIVAVSDYAKNFNTNNCIMLRNGSNIQGAASDLTLTASGLAMTFVYADATKGWIVVGAGREGDSEVRDFMTATGGTVTESGNCKIHTFTGPGTFAVSKLSTTASENTVSYMVVAGGGAGGATYGGGGGAGGFRETKAPSTPYTASPLDGYSTPGNRITVTATSFPITVGGGGAGAPGSPMAAGNNGNNSVFSTIIATAGGGGGACNHLNNNPQYNGKPGGSGGGAGRDSTTNFGNGNTPPVTPAQGTNGGQPAGTSWNGGGGGGGATAAGGNGSGGSPGAEVAGNGGVGATTSISGSPTAYAGGGGGSNSGSTGGGTATQGGGTGANPGRTATAGQTNTGAGGGGGHNSPGASGAGGSGIVIIRYKFQ